MYLALFVLYVLVSTAACDTSVVEVSDCGQLDVPYATYRLVNDIKISNLSYGFVCLNIKGNHITLDGNGFEVSSASGDLLDGVAVQYSGRNTIVTNMNIKNLRTGVHANGPSGKVHRNTITRAVNGIDVTAAKNEISHNTIKDFDASESTSGIYVYFPAIIPVDSSVTITNNVISDIRGDTFAQGVSVYYARSVKIQENQIFNITAGILGEAISVLHSEVEMSNNSFMPMTEGILPSNSVLLLTGLALLASFFYFRAPSSIPAPVPVETKREKEESEEKKRREQEDFENDGADVVSKRTLSFHIGASPGMDRF